MPEPTKPIIDRLEYLKELKIKKEAELEQIKKEIRKLIYEGV